MKENKNIDRLFQERFRNLDVNPTEEVWENIELRLRKKKDRKVIPFWWKLSGIAAAFVIGLGIYNIDFVNNQIPNNSITKDNNDLNKNNDSKSNEINKIDPNKIIVNENNAIVNTEKSSDGNNNSNQNIQNNNSVANKSDQDKSQKNNSDLNKNIQNNNAVANKSKQNNNTKNNTDINRNIQNNNAVANKSDQNNNTKNSTDLNRNIQNNNSVAHKSDQNNNTKNNTDLSRNIQNNNAVANKSNDKKIDIENSNLNKSINDNQSVVENNNPNKTINNTKNNIENKNSDLKKDIIKKLDSTSIANVVPNAMEELLNEKEKKLIKEPKLNRWQLSSNVAPIYFSSTSNGSPLDSELKNNSKQYSTNFSYGVGVNYAVNKKIKIRTGINALAIDYNTKDVVFFQNTNARSLDHVKTNTVGSLIQIENKNTLQLTPEIVTSGTILNKFNSAINQKIGYIEIPFEMSYKVLDKKFGVDVIGGVSTLVLNQNEISVVSSGSQIMIGEANNLNDVHFSTNVGLGFKYGFMKRFEARIEPVFKYQINTFNTDDGNFKPYFFGVYTGISFTF